MPVSRWQFCRGALSTSKAADRSNELKVGRMSQSGSVNLIPIGHMRLEAAAVRARPTHDELVYNVLDNASRSMGDPA
jgi:hypothetical protein